MIKVMKMKRLLAIGLTTIIIACSGSEKPTSPESGMLFDR